MNVNMYVLQMTITGKNITHRLKVKCKSRFRMVVDDRNTEMCAPCMRNAKKKRLSLINECSYSLLSIKQPEFYALYL